MENLLAISLIVSGVGLLLLFLALALLCGLMYLMTATIKDPLIAPVHSLEGHERVPGDKEVMFRAVAVVVALARAEWELRPIGTQAGDEAASPWWALHHQRQLTRGPNTRRTR